METPSTPSSSPENDIPVDISEYEKLSTLGYQSSPEISSDTEKKIEYFLLRVILVSKTISLVVFIALFCLITYSWSRNQTQNSWIMKNSTYVYQWSAICNWITSGNDRKIEAKTDFLEYLDKNPVPNATVDFKKILTDKTCLAPDTLSHLLRLEEKFLTEKLTDSYSTTLIKKFQGSTLESSYEINTILSFDPSNRINYVEVLRLIDEKIKKWTVRGKNSVSCGGVKFQGLTADMSCTIKSIPPTQPRDEAIKFLESLEMTDKLLVSYPSSLNLNVDSKDNILSTTFPVTVTYMPARYEEEILKKI